MAGQRCHRVQHLEREAERLDHDTLARVQPPNHPDPASFLVSVAVHLHGPSGGKPRGVDQRELKIVLSLEVIHVARRAYPAARSRENRWPVLRWIQPEVREVEPPLRAVPSLAAEVDSSRSPML